MPLVTLHALVLASLMAALTAVGAYMAIPVGPVPIVLATVFVLLSGTLLGSRQGALSMGGYLMVGLLGLPVFSIGRGGIAHFLTPLGGYLLGYVLAAFVAGWVSERGGGRLTADIAAVVLGTASIFAIGLPWIRFHPGADYTWSSALANGLYPFIPGAVAKGVLVVALTRALRPVVTRTLKERER